MSGIPLNLYDKNFRFAITIENYLSPRKQINDPRYVKIFFRMYNKRKGKEFQRILPHHKCTDEDYDQFYPVKK